MKQIIYNIGWIVCLTGMLFTACAQSPNQASGDMHQSDSYPVVKTEAEWRAELSNLAYQVTREHSTEQAFTGKYWDHKEKGVYNCVCCGQTLFDSSTKFKSGTGWPSFYEPINERNVGETVDNSYGMVRAEVHCSRCGAHLGHVFDDGPRPTGLRYCINSVSLDFEARNVKLAPKND